MSRFFFNDVCSCEACNDSKSLTVILAVFNAVNELGLDPKGYVFVTVLLPWWDSMVCVLMPYELVDLP